MTAASADALKAPAAYDSGEAMRRSRLWSFALAVLRLVAGSLLVATPVTAIVVVGWLMRVMRREAVVNALRQCSGESRRATSRTLAGDANLALFLRWPGLFMLTATERHGAQTHWLDGLFGGLMRNLSEGLKALLMVVVLTAPHGLLWLLSWWAGWENSFNKGYEQAFVGPLTGLAGVGVALISLSYLPMALAHQAAERRTGAALEIRHVFRLISAAGWRYVGWALLCVVAALPVFVATGAPVFIENIRPGFDRMDGAQLKAFAQAYHFWMGVYVLVALIGLRSLLARIYGRAAIRVAARAGQSERRRRRFVEGIVVAAGLALPEGDASRRRWITKFGTLLRGLALAAIWFALVAQIYVGQFLNHRWWTWVNHPLIGLPWFPGPG